MTSVFDYNIVGNPKIIDTDYENLGWYGMGPEETYTPHELENAMHDYELPRINHTVIRVSKAQMGVGGDDSWGARVHPEFLLNADKGIEFDFSFKGI